MSFTSEVKNELCKIYNKTNFENKSELYGILLFCKKFTVNEIVLNTENEALAKRFLFLIKKCFNAECRLDSIPINKKSNNKLFNISVNKEDSKKICSAYFRSENDINLKINISFLEDVSQSICFLRGVFLCCGYVSDPQNEYHLEMSTPFMNLSKDLCFVISEIFLKVSDINIKPAVVMRKGSYIIYIKDSDAIADFLGIIGAASANLEFIQYKIKKDVINKVTRKLNSEMANINKTAVASAKQLKAIEKLHKNNAFDDLPDDLKQIAILRYENPEMSLRELGEKLNPPLSRSGVNHRLVKLMDISESLKNNQ